ncbi:MAG TPA: hypothetical protein QF753_20520 [Victivallales bacterium]|nr:hypothetical protein [Victivallales bacterium]
MKSATKDIIPTISLGVLSDENDKFYIWSFEKNAWWKPAGIGFTENLSEAGTYHKDTATKLVNDASCNGKESEIMIGTTQIIVKLKNA